MRSGRKYQTSRSDFSSADEFLVYLAWQLTFEPVITYGVKSTCQSMFFKHNVTMYWCCEFYDLKRVFVILQILTTIFTQRYLCWTVIKMLHYFQLATRYRQALLINAFQFQV